MLPTLQNALLCGSCCCCILQKKVNPSQFILSPQTIRESKASLAEHLLLLLLFYWHIYLWICVCLCSICTNTLTTPQGSECFPLNLCYFKVGKQTGFANRTTNPSAKPSKPWRIFLWWFHHQGFRSPRRKPLLSRHRLLSQENCICARVLFDFCLRPLIKRVPPCARLKVNGD